MLSFHSKNIPYLKVSGNFSNDNFMVANFYHLVAKYKYFPSLPALLLSTTTTTPPMYLWCKKKVR